ncbi:venom acid phosphatase Acph-1-like [Trichogramma pretiosum]|uniref:venom acid phosphatase Acph-1-like n=1 Tax=Trichogramma pretiosum TaxID=7493 RepID=UPI0006C9B3FD|nr:venom acid phosphatase Acph-1-like [Trichogramma pretiosum]
MQFLQWLIICLLALHFTVVYSFNLKSISVIFRHGDRTPKKSEIYPLDPHKNYIKSLGYGKLTNEGKNREYQLGVSLKKRYGAMLGDDYDTTNIHAISTDYDRTKMSLLLLLAGFFPPRKDQVWNKNLNWQPIPIAVSTADDGKPNYWNSDLCPKFGAELKRIQSSAEYQKNVRKFDKLKKELSRLTGREIKDLYSMYKLYHLFYAERAMNLKLPAWADYYYPNGPLKDVALFIYKTYSYNDVLKKLNGGLFMREVLKAVSKQINESNETLPDEKIDSPKVFLYSAHASNVAAILQTLNVWNNDLPNYGSAVVLELYKKRSRYYVKILFNTGIPMKFRTLVLPGCPEYCPWEDFLKITKKVLPDDSDRCSI